MRVRNKYYLLLVLVIIGITYFLLFSTYFLSFDYKVKEYILKDRSRFVVSPKELLVIDIDKSGLDRYKRGYPLSRKALALLLARLRLAKLVVVSFPVSGATGTSGDIALEKVLRRQHNVLFAVKFSGLGSAMQAIVPSEELIWMPWRRLLPFVMIGGVNFYLNPAGLVEGLYPFFSYKGKLIAHCVIKMLALDLGFDEKAFTFSPKRNMIFWKGPSDEVLASLPLDRNSGVSVFPGLYSQVRIPSVSFSSILPYDLYQKYEHHGIDVPALEAVRGKICVLGYSDPEFGYIYPLKGGGRKKIIALHRLLARSFFSLKQGLVEYDLPLVYQFLVVFLLAIVVGFVSVYNIFAGLLVLLAELMLLIVGAYILLLHNVFFFLVKAVLSVIICFGASVVIHLRLSFLRRISDVIEKQVVREIKEKTTYLPPELDWAEIRIKEVSGSRIGGGMYDFIKINSDRLGVAIADVMDKDREAIMKISYLRGLLRSHSIITHQPGEVVYSINKALVKGGTINMTCKFLYLLLDANRSRVVFSGAGAVSFIVVDKYGKQVRCFEAEERILLGLSREIFYEPKDIKIEKGDTIILYSPSIFNLRNGEGRSYDVDRIGKLVLSYAKLPMHLLIEKIASDIKGFSSTGVEDFFIIGIKWKKDSLIPEEQDIFVGISQKEKELLLFYKKLSNSKNRLTSE